MIPFSTLKNIGQIYCLPVFMKWTVWLIYTITNVKAKKKRIYMVRFVYIIYNLMNNVFLEKETIISVH